MATREEVDAWLKPQGYKLKDDAEGSWTPGRSWWDRYIENAVKVSGASIAKGVGGIMQAGGEAILDDRPFYQQALEEYGGEGVPSPEELASKQSPHGATGTWGKSIEEKINEPEGLSEIVGSVVAGTGKSLADSANEIIERLRPKENASWLEKTGFEVLHNVGVNAPGLAASIITKKPVYGLATLGGVSYGNKYTDERNMGATPDEAHQRASAAAGSEVATELVPISVILKPGLKLTQRIGYNILSEILGENVNTAYEMMQDRAIHNPDMPLGDFITQELLPAFGNTTKVSALSSFIMGAAAHPFTRGTPRIEQSNKQEVPGIETAKTEIKEAGEVGKPEVPTPVLDSIPQKQGGKADDTQGQKGVDGGKPQGEEPGGAVQVEGTGREEIKTSGVLQTPGEVKITPSKTTSGFYEYDADYGLKDDFDKIVDEIEKEKQGKAGQVIQEEEKEEVRPFGNRELESIKDAGDKAVEHLRQTATEENYNKYKDDVREQAEKQARIEIVRKIKGQAPPGIMNQGKKLGDIVYAQYVVGVSEAIDNVINSNIDAETGMKDIVDALRRRNVHIDQIRSIVVEAYDKAIERIARVKKKSTPKSATEKSGKENVEITPAELIRKRTEAQAYAADNPITAQPVPKGEIVAKPLIQPGKSGEVPQTATATITKEEVTEKPSPVTSEKDALDKALSLQKASYGLKPKNSLERLLNAKKILDDAGIDKNIELYTENERLIENYKDKLGIKTDIQKETSILDTMVAEQKITAEDAQDISNIILEHGWTDKEVEDFVKIANNLGVTKETETNKVRNALFVSLLKQEVYKKNEEKYKWEIAANDKTISNLVKTLKIRGGSPESVKLNVDNVLGTSDEFAKIKTPEELYKVIDETFGKSITFKQLGTREIQNLAAAMLTEGKEGKKITRLEDVDKDAIETLADKAKLEKIRDATPGTVLNAVEQRAAGYIKKYMAMRAHSIGNLYKQAQNQQEKNEILDAFSQAIDSFLNIDLVERGSSSEGALSMRVQQMPLEEGVLPIEGEVRIPAAEEIEKIRSLPKDKILQILEVFDKAKTQPEYDEIAKRLTESFGRNLFETINQIWINGLLSALPTHAVNLSSGIYTALAAPAERYFAEKLSPGGGVAKGEAARLLYGEYLAFWDGIKAARAMWKTGRNLLTNETKWEIHRTDRLTSANANIMLNKLGFGNMNETLAKVVDFMGKSILNLPVRGLITADEFFKVLNYKADIYAIAHRKVTNKILEGKLDAKDAAKQTAIEAASPTYEMKDEAMLFAREQTMSRPDGTVTKILNTIIDRFPPAKVVVPFRVAPESIIKYGLERFPVLNMVHHETRANLFGHNGAVARDMELGKVAFGGMVLSSVALMALAGFITGGGPRDPELRKAWLEKNKPYSLNFGGGYSYSFKRFDFMLFGLVADLVEIAYHASDAELAKTGVAIWYALKNNLVDRQYLDGIMNVIDAFDRGGNAAYNYVKSLSGSGIPAIVALGAKASDPVVRDVVTIMDRMKSRIPGMSDELPAVRNLYGEKTMHSPTFGSIWVSPILMGVKNNDPVYDEIIKNQVEISYPERYIEGTNPGRFPSLSTQRTGHGVALTPQQYEQLMIYFGEGMKEDLTNAINSDTYKEGSEGVDGRQAAIIRSVINQHKENARSRLIYETESLQKQTYEKKQRKYEALNR